MAGRRDRPRDAAEAAALRGYAEHLRSRSGVLEWALYGAGGAIVGGLVLGLLTGGAAPGIVYVVVFLIVWTSTGVLIRRRQARRLHALADRDSSPP